MARTQTVPSNQPFDPTAGVGAPPPAAPTQTQVASPIGVPFYVTDPATGHPVLGTDGQPKRWAAPTSDPYVPFTNTNRDVLGRGGGQRPDVLPRYFDGAQWLPGSLPPDQIAQLQKRMIQAGLMKQGQGHIGVWDAQSMNAYTELLAYANSSGLDVGTALDRWNAQQTANPTALPTQVTNPDDLKAVFKKTWVNDLGVAPDDATLNSMVAAYQEHERAYQTNQQNNVSGTQAPSPATFADTQARQKDPTGVQAHDALGYENQFFGALKGVV